MWTNVLRGALGLGSHTPAQQGCGLCAALRGSACAPQTPPGQYDAGPIGIPSVLLSLSSSLPSRWPSPFSSSMLLLIVIADVDVSLSLLLIVVTDSD